MTGPENEKMERREDEHIQKTKECQQRVFGEGKSCRARFRDSLRFSILFCVALSPQASIT